MNKYIVTTEVKTQLWKKVLRFLKIMKPIETFELLLGSYKFEVGDVLDAGEKGAPLKILGKRIEEKEKIYKYKNKHYKILYDSKFKDEGIDCIVYQQLENNEICVREKKEFYRLFQKI